MAFLFEIKNNAVIPKAEALMLPEIKKIWDKDTSTSKKKALDTFAYIEFISSSLKSNPYSGYPLKKRKEILANYISMTQIIHLMRIYGRLSR